VIASFNSVTFEPKPVVLQDFPRGAIGAHATNLPYADADVHDGRLGRVDEFDQTEACGETYDWSEVRDCLFATQCDAFEAFEPSDALFDAGFRGRCHGNLLLALRFERVEQPLLARCDNAQSSNVGSFLARRKSLSPQSKDGSWIARGDAVTIGSAIRIHGRKGGGEVSRYFGGL